MIIGHMTCAGWGEKMSFSFISRAHAVAACGYVPPVGLQVSVQRCATPWSASPDSTTVMLTLADDTVVAVPAPVPVPGVPVPGEPEPGVLEPEPPAAPVPDGAVTAGPAECPAPGAAIDPHAATTMPQAARSTPRDSRWRFRDQEPAGRERRVMPVGRARPASGSSRIRRLALYAAMCCVSSVTGNAAIRDAVLRPLGMSVLFKTGHDHRS